MTVRGGVAGDGRARSALSVPFGTAKPASYRRVRGRGGPLLPSRRLAALPPVPVGSSASHLKLSATAVKSMCLHEVTAHSQNTL